jgi:hypothetical protein
VHIGFWQESLRERGRFEDLGLARRIILKIYLQKVRWGMDWIDLAQDRDRWQALINAVMNLQVP